MPFTECGERSRSGKSIAVRAVGEEGRPDSENKTLTPTPDALFIRIALGGRLVLFLIDTGAAVTCINGRHPVVRQLRWSDPTVVLTTASGANLSCTGQSKVKIQFGEDRTVFNIRRVTNLSPVAILGADVVYQGSITREGEAFFFSIGKTKIQLLRSEELTEEERAELEATTCSISPVIKNHIVKKRPPVLPEPRRSSGWTRWTKKRNGKSTQTEAAETTSKGTITFFDKPRKGVRAKKEGEAKVSYGENLSREQKEAAEALVTKYRECFANTDAEVGRTGMCEFNLQTTGAMPAVWKRSRKTAEVHREFLRTQIETLLSQGVIRKSSSAWASRPIVVPKGETFRLVIGYEAVNDVTTADGFELPLVEEAINRLGKSCFFAKLDMASAYHQIPIAEESRHKTAFSADGEHYEYCCVSFGLKNAPAGFARVAARVLNEMIAQGKPITLFFDDIVVGGRTFAEHMELLEEVLRRLAEAELVLKSSKCKIGLEETECLGFIIDARGARPDPAKVEGIREFPLPEDVTGLRGFLGLINFYTNFIPDMHRELSPLHEVCGGKNVKLSWTREMKVAFEEAKEKFASAMLLARPDFTRKFIVTTDASLKGAAAILSQVNSEGVEVPIQCWSKAFDSAQKKWSTRDQEMYAFYHAVVKKWRHMLLGRQFEWRTDHKPLQGTEHEPKARVQRWIWALDEFDYVTRYVAGPENGAADTLSRYGVRAEHEENRISSVVATEAADNRILVDKSQVAEILKEFHDKAGHRGAGAVISHLNELYFWPSMKNDVKTWCETCQICNQVKPRNAQNAPVGETSQATAPLEDFAVDLMKFPEGQVIVVIDKFSRYVEMGLLDSKEARTVAEFLENRIFWRYGTPKSMLSDNGKEFTSIQEYAKNLGFEYFTIAPGHPQSNGMVEKANRTLQDIIATELLETGKTLAEVIPRAQYHYNATIHTSTGHAPYELVFNRKPPRPERVLERRAKRGVNQNSNLAKWAAGRAEEIRTKHQQVTEMDEGKKKRIMENQGERGPLFEVGERVMMKNPDHSKGKPKMIGPFEVTSVLEGKVYDVKNTENFKQRFRRHEDALSRVIPRPEELQPRSVEREGEVAGAPKKGKWVDESEREGKMALDQREWPELRSIVKPVKTPEGAKAQTEENETEGRAAETLGDAEPQEGGARSETSRRPETLGWKDQLREAAESLEKAKEELREAKKKAEEDRDRKRREDAKEQEDAEARENEKLKELFMELGLEDREETDAEAASKKRMDREWEKTETESRKKGRIGSIRQFAEGIKRIGRWLSGRGTQGRVLLFA